MLLPLFVATWRTSLYGLGAQGLLMALIAYRLDPNPHTVGDWVTLVDLGLVRGVVTPAALFSVLRARRAPARNDVISPNLISWTLAFAMVLLAFSFAEQLVSEPGEQRTLVAVAASGLMLGFLVLAAQSGPLSQMIGALRVENAIALFELGGRHHPNALGIQLALSTVFLITVGLFRWYLRTIDVVASGEARASSERPTL
jgi:hydrogenase-4 membrane subunit HyfE